VLRTGRDLSERVASASRLARTAPPSGTTSANEAGATSVNDAGATGEPGATAATVNAISLHDEMSADAASLDSPQTRLEAQ